MVDSIYANTVNFKAILDSVDNLKKCGYDIYGINITPSGTILIVDFYCKLGHNSYCITKKIYEDGIIEEINVEVT